MEEESEYRQNLRLKKEEWPAHVKEVSLEELGLLGRDAQHNLYWDGKPVEVRKRLDLRWWQVVLAIMTALGAFASGAVAVIRLWLDCTGV